MKWGLTVKVTLLSCLVVAVLLMAVGFALVAFKQYKTTLERVTGEQLEALMTATRLVQQTEGLVNASAMLLLAENHIKRREALFEAQDRKEWINRLVDELQAHPGVRIHNEDLEPSRNQLIANLNRINELVRQRINLRADVYFQESTNRDDLRQLERINAEIGEMIRANEELSKDLTVAVSYQVNQLRSSMRMEVEDLNFRILHQENRLLITVLLAFALVLLTSFYIHRFVVARVIELQRALSQTHPQPSDIPVRGEDEIAWMAQSIHRYVGKIQENENKILEMNRELSFLATHDALTQLHNRHFFDRRIHEITHCQEDKSYSAAMIDIDLFKAVNDSLGHAAGDQVIKAFARLLRGSLPEEVLLARIGGEEFAVVFADQSFDEARQYLDSFRQKLHKQPIHLADQTVRITASLGLAGYCPAGSINACLKRADELLYEAKQQGRNQLKMQRLTEVDLC
ncbi:GGDEF domain-containing protein [Marinospirillum perlucidum]|uniref:GGDEF domain-containing protein n=1 Tax=Marinospirillum perlucidum TaxID=1982602 RepID=UPI000DF321DD|nr:GGDEF domain-containing protein [Marinospirillum perlucidum]